MVDFDVQRCTRRCAATDRQLQPGEPFYSVLIAEGADVVRQDYSVQAWEGPPERAIGSWKSQMPDPKAERMHWAPNDVMLHYFAEMAERPEQRELRYVLALLMIRRRIVRLEETSSDELAQETLLLYCPRNETEYEVAVAEPPPERINAIQESLAKLLFANAD